jgi:hypothetical protein
LAITISPAWQAIIMALRAASTTSGKGGGRFRSSWHQTVPMTSYGEFDRYHNHTLASRELCATVESSKMAGRFC